MVDGKYKKYQKDFNCSEFAGFRVLLVTTSKQRLLNMRKIGQEIEFNHPQAKKFIWLTTFDQLNNETIFNHIWQSIDGQDDNCYGIQ